jgi:hypothetical protein
MVDTVDLMRYMLCLTRPHYSDLHINQHVEAHAANKAIITGSFTERVHYLTAFIHIDVTRKRTSPAFASKSLIYDNT